MDQCNHCLEYHSEQFICDAFIANLSDIPTPGTRIKELERKLRLAKHALKTIAGQFHKDNDKLFAFAGEALKQIEEKDGD